MILTGFDLYRYRLPLAAPLTLGGVAVDAREGVVVRLTSSTGAVGWGEASPLPGFSRELVREAQEQLEAQRETLRGWFLPSDGTDPEGTLVHHLDGQGLMPSVRFGLELALWNLYARAGRKTLAGLLGQHPRPTVFLNGLLMGSSQEVLENARRMRDAGYRAVKLKVGRGALDEEVRLVRAVCRVLGRSVGLRLDANRAWRLDEAAAFVRGVTGVAIDYIEEPLRDPKHLPELVSQYGVSVALDETLLDGAGEALEQHAYARAVILKPTLLGGLVPTLRLARRATALGMTPVLSASFETGIGLCGLVALAAAVNAEDVPAGLDTYRWLADDVVTPALDLRQGAVDVATLLGTTRDLKAAFLREI